MRRILFLVPLLALFPAFVFADLELNLKYPSFGGVDIKSVVDTPQAIPGLIAWAYALIVGISGFVAFIMLVWGGVQWMGSAGDPGAISNARDRIKSALLGLLLVLTSFLLLEVVNPDVVKLGPLNLPGFTIPKTVKPPPPSQEELNRLVFSANGQEGSVRVRPGEEVTLSWETGKNYQKCEATSSPLFSNWDGDVGKTGTRAFTPTQNYAFGLNCFRNSEEFDLKTVAVYVTEQQVEPGSAPTVNLVVSGKSLRSGQNSEGPIRFGIGGGDRDNRDNRLEFAWESNAEQCTASGNLLGQATTSTKPSDKKEISVNAGPFKNGEYVFTVTCSGSQFAQPASDSVIVNVSFD